MKLDRHFLEDYDHAYVTSFWGFAPETWGCVSFHDESRRDRYIREEADPFVMAVYVTDTSRAEEKAIRGKLAGFYELSHQKGYRDDLVSPEMREVERGRWPYALVPIRAWRVLPSFAPIITDVIPEVYERVRAVGRYGWRIPDERFQVLKRLPVERVDLWGQKPLEEPVGYMPTRPYRVAADDRKRSQLGWVPSVFCNLSGHFSEPQDPEKHLYILELEGPTEAIFAGLMGRRIIKVGLSSKPRDRLEAFRRAFPKSKLHWTIRHSTESEGFEPYASPEIAEAGGMAMKRFLGASPTAHLGGEFYMASDSDIEVAWNTGRKKALEAQTEYGNYL